MIGEHLFPETHLCESLDVGVNRASWHCRDDAGALDCVNGRRAHSFEKLIDREIIVAFEKLEGGLDAVREVFLVGRPDGNHHGHHTRE